LNVEICIEFNGIIVVSIGYFIGLCEIFVLGGLLYWRLLLSMVVSSKYVYYIMFGSVYCARTICVEMKSAVDDIW